MPELNEYDARHLRNLSAIEKRIEHLYTEAIRELIRIAEILDVDADKPFSFDDYPQVRERVNKLFKKIQEKTETIVVNGVNSAWTLANNENNVLCDYVFGDNKLKLTKEQQKKYYSNNDTAVDAFHKRRSSGLNLSDRVWNYTRQFKAEIEMGLDLGLGDGMAAVELAHALKQYLKYPNNMFRRVRDKHGALHLSKAAKAFHPGQGVYRSSFKNARRLAATETNMAYRTADHERWGQLDFVVGIEVRLSNNHTFTDICDDLKGKYPKTFKFTGWHPLCRCHAVPVLKSHEELMADNERILNGEEPLAGSVNEVRDAPEGFKDWVRDNKGRIEKAEKKGTMPYFLKDNNSYVQSAFRAKGIFNSVYPTSEMSGLIPTDKLDLSDVNSVMGKIAGENGNYFQRGYAGVFTAPDGEQYFMSTDINGKIFVNFARLDSFDAGASLVSAFEKLKKGIALTEHEEYSIEVLWHEILHNRSKNTVILPPINTTDTGFQRVVAETVNQLVARHTYPDFLSKLGGKSAHQNWILKNGYGYSDTVNNLRSLLSTLNIDEDVFVKKANRLLMEDYSDFDDKMENMIVKASKRKDSWNVIDAFNRIDYIGFDKYLEVLNK